jgi:hypothetical protein
MSRRNRSAGNKKTPKRVRAPLTNRAPKVPEKLLKRWRAPRSEVWYQLPLPLPNNPARLSVLEEGDQPV